MEKVFFKFGFEKDFNLSKVDISIETQKKHLPMISSYEQIIKTSATNEIKSQPNFDMIFFGLANFYYNFNEYSKALEKIDFLLTLNSCDVSILYSKAVLLELSKLPEKARVL